MQSAKFATVSSARLSTRAKGAKKATICGKSPKHAKSEVIRCSDNCRTCIWSHDDCTSCFLGFLKLEESYLSHEKLNFDLIAKDSENEGLFPEVPTANFTVPMPIRNPDYVESHKAVKAKCVTKCPETNQNFTIVENRLAGMCV